MHQREAVVGDAQRHLVGRRQQGEERDRRDPLQRAGHQEQRAERRGGDRGRQRGLQPFAVAPAIAQPQQRQQHQRAGHAAVQPQLARRRGGGVRRNRRDVRCHARGEAQAHQQDAQQRELREQQREAVDEQPVEADLQPGHRGPRAPVHARAARLRVARACELAPHLVDRLAAQLGQTEDEREQLRHDARHRAGQARQVGPVHLVDVDAGGRVVGVAFEPVGADVVAIQCDAGGLVGLRARAVAHVLGQQVVGDGDAAILAGGRRGDVGGGDRVARRGGRRGPLLGLEVGARRLQERLHQRPVLAPGRGRRGVGGARLRVGLRLQRRHAKRQVLGGRGGVAGAFRRRRHQQVDDGARGLAGLLVRHAVDGDDGDAGGGQGGSPRRDATGPRCGPVRRATLETHRGSVKATRPKDRGGLGPRHRAALPAIKPRPAPP